MTDMDARKKQRDKAQAEAQRAHDRMLEFLLQFQPAESLSVSDVKCIARWAQTLAFDATEPFRDHP